MRSSMLRWLCRQQHGRSPRVCGCGRRQVSTLSPLAAVFNTKPTRKLNLSLTRSNVGLFGIPELQDYTGFYLLQENVQSEVANLIREVVSPERKRKMVEVFDQLSDSLCKVADMADFVRVAHPKPEYNQAAEDACVNLSGLVEKLNTNVDIHQALKRVIQEGDILATDDVDKRVAELFMFDFEQSGIHLDAQKRKAFVELNEKILLLGSYFVQGTQRPTTVPKTSLPENLRYCFGIDGENVMVTGLFSDHYSDLVREAAYRIFLHPDPHQLDLLASLLSARRRLAHLVGFPTYAHRAVRGTIMDTPETVMEFLNGLTEELKHRANQDYDYMLQLKKSHGGGGDVTKIMPWDPPYYTAVGRQKMCNLNTSELAPYFSVGACMGGLDNLFRCLYGVSLQHVDMQPGETWNYDVRKLAVVHQTEGILGYIYCDFFERSGKPTQDCHFTIRGGRQREDGGYQPPMVVLQLNFPQALGSTPSLLSPGMMENLFHEFGHAMHSMLGRTKYQHVTGTRCSTDFAEIPSVLMEFFAFDPRVIASFARHYKTGEPLSQSTIRNICYTKRLFAASDLQLQTFYSALDQVYHGPEQSRSSTEVLAEVQERYYAIPHVPNTAWQLRFGHLVGYGAKYYAYLLSRAVASRIWYSCFQADPFNREMGEKYRREMLAHGGGKHPSELIEAMLGEKPTVDRLVQSLVQDLEEGQRDLKEMG